MKTSLSYTPELDRKSDGYEQFLASVRAAFEKNMQEDKSPLFTTDATDLFDLFLENLPADARQHYTCRACRRFVDTYGGLVRIDENGTKTPAMWATATAVPEFFSGAVKAIRKAVNDASITGVFATSERVLGTPVTGSWNHLAVVMPDRFLNKSRIKTSEQVMAEKAEDCRILVDALRKYNIETVRNAVSLLSADTLYRSEKVLGIAEWFFDLKKKLEGESRKRAKNLIWYAVATAPVGFCHVSSSMIGTLLDDIEAGLDINAVSKRFANKMNPLSYQRPQAAPSRGNVEQTERIVEKLGIANSLKRRFARVDELEAVWKPSPVRDPYPHKTGVFSMVKTKEETKKNGFTATLVGKVDGITFEKFKREVLPSAKTIEFAVPIGLDNYCALLTAEDPDAPPIIRWDHEDNRNPFSWYVYSGGSMPETWNLHPGRFVPVTAVVMQPNMWDGNHDYEGKAVIFVLKDCKDANHRNSGCGLFPEILKSELHEVRSTIEAYSRQNSCLGYEQSSACGIRIQANSKSRARFRVTTDYGVTEYVIDRFD